MFERLKELIGGGEAETTDEKCLLNWCEQNRLEGRSEFYCPEHTELIDEANKAVDMADAGEIVEGYVYDCPACGEKGVYQDKSGKGPLDECPECGAGGVECIDAVRFLEATYRNNE